MSPPSERACGWVIVLSWPDRENSVPFCAYFDSPTTVNSGALFRTRREAQAAIKQLVPDSGRRARIARATATLIVER